MQKVDRQKWERLLIRLELLSDASLADALAEVHDKLDDLQTAEEKISELEEEVEELENAERPPDEEAARLVHAQHSDTFSFDLRLCRHPDCERIWHG